jgi:23S rRNA (cytidine1920-2'-O)/16S rRNA (cytidine1409-2'-O)-methyltransferase
MKLMTQGPPKIRLDQLLVEKGMVESREKAKALIMAGLVEVAGERVAKPGRLITHDAPIALIRRHPIFVSRGGHKLEAALEHFSIEVRDLVLMDVGASTGGFTDCLLKRGARKVVAVDVGYGQLDWKLRQDPRVTVLERTNIRYLKPEAIPFEISGAVIDVSFISLELVVPAVSDLLMKSAFVVALVKPQFEVGKGQVGKGGVVRDPGLHEAVMARLSGFFQRGGWTVRGHMPSPLLGPKGNREFFIYLIR